MKKIIFFIAIFLLLSFNLVQAITEQENNEAKNLIDSKADCKSLSDSQLEIIGEYYMEQMHPGEAHKLMHKMMGLEEGSKDEEKFHVNMAKKIYCNENINMMGGANGGMMGMGGMMGYGGNFGGMTGHGSGMGFGWNWFFLLFQFLFLSLIILAIVALIKWISKQDKK